MLFRSLRHPPEEKVKDHVAVPGPAFQIAVGHGKFVEICQHGEIAFLIKPLGHTPHNPFPENSFRSRGRAPAIGPKPSAEKRLLDPQLDALLKDLLFVPGLGVQDVDIGGHRVSALGQLLGQFVPQKVGVGLEYRGTVNDAVLLAFVLDRRSVV